MSSTTIPTGNTTSVEELLRYAAHRFEAAGVEFRPPRMTRLIRRAGVTVAREAVENYLDKIIEQESRDKTWDDFERRAFTGYADPTPALAHRNLQADGWYTARGAR